MGTARQADLDFVLMTGHGPLSARIFPADGRLAQDLRRITEQLDPTLWTPAELPVEVEARLRLSYPRLIIRRREQLASLSETEDVWYVMRDGRVDVAESNLDGLDGHGLAEFDGREPGEALDAEAT